MRVPPRATAAPVTDVRASAVGVHDRAQRLSKAGKVAVVDATVVELAGELIEQAGPVPAGRGSRGS